MSEAVAAINEPNHSNTSETKIEGEVISDSPTISVGGEVPGESEPENKKEIKEKRTGNGIPKDQVNQ